MGKERDIYIKELIMYILQKSKIILAWMLFFAIILNVYSVVISYRNILEIQKDEKTLTQDFSSYTSGLTADEIESVDESYKLYQTYKKSLDESVDYYNNSLKMQINANSVPTVTVQYKINNSNQLMDIVSAYSNIILANDFCKKVSDSLENVKSQYVSELINFSLPEDRYNQSVHITQNGVNGENGDSALMLVQIIAPTKEMCETMADLVEDEIQIQTQDIQKNLDDFTLIKISRSFIETADNVLLTQQQECVTKINTMQALVDNIKNALSEEQQNYYNALINQDNETSVVTVDEKETKLQMINFKYILVGACIGFLLSCCWYVVIYMTSRYLRAEKEIEDYYNIPIIESLFPCGNNVEEKDFISDDKLEMICANINVAVKKLKMKHIHITTTSSSAKVEMIKKTIFERLNCDNLKVTNGENVTLNTKSFNDFVEADGVVLIEEVGKSDFECIGKEIKLCDRNDSVVIGAVIV